MADSLESAFAACLGVVKAAAPTSRETEQPGAKIRLLQSEKQRINSEVERLERTSEFKSLASVAACELSNKDSKEWFHDSWEHLLRTFFRLSDTYLAHLSNEAFATAEDEHVILATRFREEVSAQREHRIHLMPIELVSFSQDLMEFDGFKIQTFKKSELDDLLKQPVCKLFYPWAAVDTEELACYWFLVCEDEAELSLGWNLDWSAKVEVGYSPFSGALKQAFRRLVLYPWSDQFTRGVQLLTAKKPDPWSGPFLFSAPFVLSVSKSLITSPRQVPDLSVLVTEPIFDDEGRECGEAPVDACRLDEEETAEFCSFISEADRLIKRARVDAPEWRFADTALNFLEKAFLSSGAEQLLWHITTVEALLGEKVDSGLTKILRTRAGYALGGTAEKRRQIGKNFEDLYSLQSDFVHGNATLPDREFYMSHLGQAREMARKLTLWMLHYLASVGEATKDGARLPLRENLLKVLDMDEQSREEVSALLSIVPKDFPNSPEW